MFFIREERILDLDFLQSAFIPLKANAMQKQVMF